MTDYTEKPNFPKILAALHSGCTGWHACSFKAVCARHCSQVCAKLVVVKRRTMVKSGAEQHLISSFISFDMVVPKDLRHMPGIPATTIV